MSEDNMYTEAVKRRLRNYRYLQTYIKNIEDDLAAKESELDLEPAPGIANYSGDLPGGAPELYTVERAAAKSMSASAEIARLRASLEDVRRVVRKLDRALEQLNKIARRVVTGYYIEDLTWDELGREYGYSGKWAAARSNRAIKTMAVMLFGIEAMGAKAYQQELPLLDC